MTFMYNKRRLFKAVLLISVFSTLGMSCLPSAKHGQMTKEREKAVAVFFAQIKSAYEKGSLEEMVALIDPNYAGRLQFADELQENFFLYRQAEIKFITDTITEEQNRLSIRLHWFKNNMDSLGFLTKQQGNAEFILSGSEGNYKLLQMKGDNPFF